MWRYTAFSPEYTINQINFKIHFISAMQLSLLQYYIDIVVKSILINVKVLDIPFERESIPCSV